MADLSVRRFPARDGLDLAYREIGSGRPLVWLHGFTGNGLGWIEHGHAADVAERGYRLILPDLRGHGESARPHDPASYPPDVLADDGLALIEWLGLDDYDLGGYSLGARVVLRMLVRGAQPAHAIVAGQGLDAVDQETSRTGPFRSSLTAIVNQEDIEPGSPAGQMKHWITQFGGDPQALLYVLDTHVATPIATLSQVTTPTLVVIGDEDTSHATADKLAEALPNAQFIRVPGNHFTASAGQELATAIVAFLGGHSSELMS
jgi:pimeloyl-ACP methyl ester carboxylesterase